MDNSKHTTGLTVGVITHERSTLFSDLLESLKLSVKYFLESDYNRDVGTCSVLIVNNSGASSHDVVQKIVDQSAISSICSVLVIDSPENNIAVGRNLILENTESDLLIFVDDDEYPAPDWIYALYDQYRASGSAVVAGPIEPVYPVDTPRWVAAVDLHNKGSLVTGDKVRHVATGNCLLDLSQIGAQRFDRAFGLSGGSDGLFFDELADQGLFVNWREDAIVYETIPESRTSSRYMIFRCMTQGHNYKRVVLRNASLSTRVVFMLKALVVAPISLLIGLVTMPINDRLAALWLKRGLTNLGKLIKLSKRLYG